jgi:hypothetical protein
MPSVHLAEAVALAQNIEPSSGSVEEINAPSDAEWRKKLMEANAGWVDGRLLHAKGHLSDIPDNPYRYVKLPVFADWAQSLPHPWKLPKDFPGWSDINWNKWGKKDVAAVWEAVAIATWHSPDEVTFQGAKASFGREFGEMLDAAMSCLDVSLPVHSVIEADPYDAFRDDPPTGEIRTKVLLVKFREWAEGKGYDLPDRFPGSASAAKSPAPTPGEPPSKAAPPEEKPLRTRERTTLLVIIAALAKDAGIDVGETWKSAQRIEKLTLDLGARISPEAISQKLREIPDALERGGKFGLKDD